jgi:hypothetical protein
MAGLLSGSVRGAKRSHLDAGDCRFVSLPDLPLLPPHLLQRLRSRCATQIAYEPPFDLQKAAKHDAGLAGHAASYARAALWQTWQTSHDLHRATVGWAGSWFNLSATAAALIWDFTSATNPSSTVRAFRVCVSSS